jgi:putative transposase
MTTSIRTISCLLEVSAEQKSALTETMKAFAGACNYILTHSPQQKPHRFALHKQFYQTVRNQFGLSANLAQQVIARVAASKKSKAFRSTSVSYDAKIFSFREKDWTFSLNTTQGRIRVLTKLEDFQRKYLTGQKPTSATLVYRKGKFFLNVQVKQTVPDPKPVKDYLGVDLGLTNIAVDSTGEAFSGEQVERNRVRRATARTQYQRTGTKSAKRRLKKMAGRQARFQKHTNHVISKRLIAKAKTLGLGLALENLSGVRGRAEKTASRSLRERIGNWGFYQLRAFIEYKALREGVPVVLVNPAYTSMTCSACGHCEKANRVNQAEFICKTCELSVNADENAARNIRAWAVCKPARKVSLCERVSPPQE